MVQYLKKTPSPSQEKKGKPRAFLQSHTRLPLPRPFKSATTTTTASPPPTQTPKPHSPDPNSWTGRARTLTRTSKARERAHAHPPPACRAAFPPPRRVHDQSERDGAGHPVRLRRGRGPVLRPRPVVLLRARVQRRVELRIRGLFLRRRGRLRHLAPEELLRVAVLRAPLLQPLRVGWSAPAGQILRVRAQRRRRTVQHQQQAREAAHAQLRICQGRLLRRPRQLLPELQQHALSEALRRVRARLAGPRPGGGQEDTLSRRDQAVPEQDLEAVAEGGAWRCCRGCPAAEEPLGVHGAVVATSPGRLARGEAGRHRECHRALQGVDPPCVHVGARLVAAAVPERPRNVTCTLKVLFPTISHASEPWRKRGGSFTQSFAKEAMKDEVQIVKA